MSDSIFPENLGTTTFVEEEGTLDFFNSEDTYQFTLPTQDKITDEANSFGRQFNKVQSTGFDVSVSIESNQPTIVSFGVDNNNNGIFEDNEIIARDTVNPSDGVLEIVDASRNLEDNLLDFGQNYFVEVESTDTFSDTSYELTVEAPSVFEGEISRKDSSYIFNDREYYYDQLDELAIKAGDFDNSIEVGDEYSVSVISESSLNPLLFLLNKDTNEVIDVDFEADTVNLGGENYNQVALDFTVLEGINYTFSVESVEPGQTGNYYFELI